METLPYLLYSKNTAIVTRPGCRIGLIPCNPENVYYDGVQYILSKYYLNNKNFLQGLGSLEKYQDTTVTVIDTLPKVTEKIIHLIYINSAKKYTFIQNEGLKFNKK